jgi:hypothetical protein
VDDSSVILLKESAYLLKANHAMLAQSFVNHLPHLDTRTIALIFKQKRHIYIEKVSSFLDYVFWCS